ncbi:hypothetical protein [Streptomyces sp. NPDC091046]|uniref:hypothetical protein n=1 Tax=Streptomyces sp. NPDC091046 TaxID=3365973 RepID=UPI0038051A80
MDRRCGGGRHRGGTREATRLAAGNPLFELPNVIVTPHAAYYSEEAIGAVRTIAAEEAVRVLTGQPAPYPVNELSAGA